MLRENIEEKKLPDGWALTTLNECCEILDNYRKPINSTERNLRIKGKPISSLFPYYGATGLVGYIDDFLIDGEYILLGEDGAPFLDFFKSKAYIVDGKIWVNNHAHILKAFGANKYLCHFLNQVNYRDFVTGTTRLKLNQSSMRQIPVKFPPLSEQQRIVAKIEELFSNLDDGIKNLENARAQLKIYRQSVLKYAFEGKLTETSKDSNSNYNSDNTLHPIKYAIKTLGQGWSPRCDRKPSINYDKWGVIKTTAVQPCNYIESENKMLPDNLEPRPHLEIMPGDLLITRAGPRNRVGVCCLVRKSRPRLMICDKVYRLRTNSIVVSPEYIEVVLNSPHIKDAINKLKTGISDSGVNLTQKGFLGLTIPVPSLRIQQQIVSEIEARLSVCDKLEETVNENLKKADALRQSILKKAFEGKLVPQNPNDEPAQLLLQRIKTQKEKITTKTTRTKK